jgi:hexosaminidase
MMKKLLVLLAFIAAGAQAQSVMVIPQPTEVTELKGKPFVVKAATLDQALATAATTVDPAMGREEYTLEVSKKGVNIVGGSEAGVFYGLETLKQMMVTNAVWTTKNSVSSAVFTLPQVKIHDKPAFEYRGAMLDVSRHHADKHSVMRFLDMMAIHKLNTFHWHLTDDQGWRIQIKSHPELTSVGSVRAHTLIGHGGNPPFKYDGKPVAGCYTQDEVREIVAYAAKLHITVIPEIEMPGHAEAALAAYPEIGCTGGPYEVWPRWGVNKEVFCAGNDKTFEILEDVLAEVIELFPSKIIHIGGDECPKDRWKECPKCQARIKNEGLKDEHHLQSYFIQRIEKWMIAHGRNIIGWDEILEGGLSKTAMVMSWRGNAGGIAAAKAGNYVVMSPNSHCYLDYYQARPTNKEPFGIGGYLPLAKVYTLDPYEGIPADYHKFILGVQGNLWREYVSTMSHTFYMVLPRIAAIAETGWSYPYKDFDSFKSRLKTMRILYDIYGYKYAEHDDQPIK